jgi:hypothetical protein
MSFLINALCHRSPYNIKDRIFNLLLIQMFQFYIKFKIVKLVCILHI